MASMRNIFYAYPSFPPDTGNTIESAITEIAGSGLVNITSWRSLGISGKIVIDEILKGINNADVFAGDLTYLNPNVLFELGFAIGRSKRLWITLNSDIERLRADYRRFAVLLDPIGYSQYTNSRTLKDALYREQPWTDLEGRLINFPNLDTSRERSRLFYLKSASDSDASLRLSSAISSTKIFDEVVTDDPAEMVFETLNWYVQTIIKSDAVIAHFLSDKHKDTTWHNAKCGLVSGIALGLSKDILMLAHFPYTTPFDFTTYLRVHSTWQECESLFNSWTRSIDGKIKSRWEGIEATKATKSDASELARLSIGEITAENETESLKSYFVETSAYLSAFRGQNALFIGRKGMGKTANMYKAAEDIRKDVRNHVCLIKPVGYEVEGLIGLLSKEAHRSERGYLMESLWKFLIYTELAVSVSEEIRSNRAEFLRSEHERNLLEFVKINSAVIDNPFSIRLQEALEGLSEQGKADSASGQRIKVSEKLHAGLLRQLRQLLGEVLAERKRVAVLVDNLDKAWGARDDVELLSELIFGLLGVSDRIVEEFQASNYWKKGVNFSLAIYLRSDIFARIQEIAREPDKLNYVRLSWDSEDMLLRVLDERLFHSLDRALTTDEIWSRYFCRYAVGLPIRKYICSTTLPRPRDIIYFARTALEEAINRNHVHVEEADFVAAARKYSEYALDTLVAEDDPSIGKLELVLFEFAGSPRDLYRNEIVQLIERAGVSGDHTAYYLNLLCDLNFLLIGTASGEFVAARDEKHRRVLQNAARTIAERARNSSELYRINYPFHPVLQILA